MRQNYLNTLDKLDFIVIGFGVSGIACSIELAIKNKKFIVIEKQSSSGGCWNNALETSCLQTDRKYYKFKGVEYDIHTPRFPSKMDIISYLNKTIHYYSLGNNVLYGYIAVINHFNVSENVWELDITDIITHTKTSIKSKYIIFCGGVHSRPHYPKNIKLINNNKINQSIDIIHSSELLDYINNNKYTKNIKIKRMIIVGNGASGCDILNYFNSDINMPEITMIYRSNKHFIRKYVLGIPGSIFLNKWMLCFFERCPFCINYILMYLANMLLFNSYLETPLKKIQYNNIQIFENKTTFWLYKNEAKCIFIRCMQTV